MYTYQVWIPIQNPYNFLYFLEPNLTSQFVHPFC